MRHVSYTAASGSASTSATSGSGSTGLVRSSAMQPVPLISPAEWNDVIGDATSTSSRGIAPLMDWQSSAAPPELLNTALALDSSGASASDLRADEAEEAYIDWLASLVNVPSPSPSPIGLAGLHLTADSVQRVGPLSIPAAASQYPHQSAVASQYPHQSAVAFQYPQQSAVAFQYPHQTALTSAAATAGATALFPTPAMHSANHATTHFSFNQPISMVLASLMQDYAASTPQLEPSVSASPAKPKEVVPAVLGSLMQDYAASTRQPAPSASVSPDKPKEVAPAATTPKDMVRQLLERRGVTSGSLAERNEEVNTALAERAPTPDELERLGKRRQRNKAAATRCRQRRRDRIGSLEGQIDTLNSSQVNLKKELSDLHAQRQNLEDMLESHVCVYSESKDNKEVEATASKGVEKYQSAADKKFNDGMDAASTEYHGDRPGTSVCLSRSISVEEGNADLGYDDMEN